MNTKAPAPADQPVIAPKTDAAIDAYTNAVIPTLSIVAKEIVGNPADVLFALSQRIGTLTPSLEAFLGQQVDFILTQAGFHAVDILSDTMLQAIKNDREEMLPPMVRAYQDLVPNTWPWPFGPNAPRAGRKDSDSRPIPFLSLVHTPTAAAAFIDGTDNDSKDYQQALSDAVAHHLGKNNVEIATPVIAAYKAANPEKWQWPLGSTCSAKANPFFNMAKSPAAVAALIDATAADNDHYRQALSNAILHYIVTDQVEITKALVAAYKVANPEKWQWPMGSTCDAEAKPFLNMAEDAGVVTALIDDKAKDNPHYQQALSNALVHYIGGREGETTRTLITAYKVANPNKWSWPMGSTADQEAVPFLSMTADAGIVGALIDERGRNTNYQQALSNAIDYHLERSGTDVLAPMVASYKAAHVASWQRPLNGGDPFLCRAANHLNRDAVTVFLDAGANVNEPDAEGWPPLAHAAWWLDDDKKKVAAGRVVDALLDKKADPKTQITASNGKTYSGYDLIQMGSSERLKTKADAIWRELHPNPIGVAAKSLWGRLTQG